MNYDTDDEDSYSRIRDENLFVSNTYEEILVA